MTRRPHDALFKAGFEDPTRAGQMFRAILPEPLCNAISWDTLTRESGSFIDPELKDSHSDMLFSVKIGEERAFLYVLLEHQSTNDPTMPRRVLEYATRIWKRDGLPQALLIPIVISHAPGGWTAPVSFHALFEPHPASIPGMAALTPSFSIIVEDLTRLSNDDIKGMALDAFARLTLWALRDGRYQDKVLHNLEFWADTFREALEAQSGVESVSHVLLYFTLVSSDMKYEQLRAKMLEHVPEAEEATMTIAEELRQEGLKRGVQQGLQQGLQQGVQQGLSRGELQGRVKALLEYRLGELTAEHVTRVDVATEEQLVRYASRAKTAETIDAVFAEQR